MFAAHSIWRACVRDGACGLLLIWAAFWLWFAAASMLSEWDGTLAWKPIGFFVLPLVLLTAIGLARPRLGGLLLIAGAAAAAWYFDSSAARLMLALPMGVIGGLLVWVGDRPSGR